MEFSQPIPVRLYLFQLSLIEDGTPIPGYLIQTSDGKNILIDTGYPVDGSMLSCNRPPGRAIRETYPVVDQLAALGLTPHDIHFLVCSHFDPDHSGCHDAFPEAELIVQRRHYEFACATQDDRFTFTRPHWNAPGLCYQLIDGDLELVPGVELIETSGHVPGHQAILVRLPHTGPILLAIDAAAMETEFDPATRMDDNGSDLNPTEAAASARKLLALAKREGVVLTVFGHDEIQWPTLKKAPEFYC
ncbi:N-acyl homoserine lactonase family protein [Ktedonospora formicarum]|uniref:N-acyl homoserine lactonase AttM n=1 Tax=Ktedonospora formicarum TaxID=2778364 RepID=A0A8J3I915_9CHLR|nr:N-acyl homoserine lactonase family protein [Ktedonospora formicarum]GHO46899.1 N-acyl homoserine lactonase AttM [Ktedonospora formicarum]